jgi:hypothetical protein
MSNKKQTAVDFFFEKIKSHFKGDGFEDLVTTMAITKLKEKEQMKSIYNPTIMQNEDGKLYAKSFEQYYKETYTDKP